MTDGGTGRIAIFMVMVMVMTFLMVSLEHLQAFPGVCNVFYYPPMVPMVLLVPLVPM